jgi:hypothetical protein
MFIVALIIDIQLSEKDLLYCDVHGAILRKDIQNNISNQQFVNISSLHTTKG